MRRALLLVMAVFIAVPAGAHADVSGPAIVGFLNAQRAAHGIPAGIIEDPALSDGCAKHNRYSAQNEYLGHSEDPSRPGYTPEGERAAQTSVLYAGSGPWTAARNPFETAPIHLHQLLAPRTDRMGASENDGYGCATTQASKQRPAPSSPVTYTYPGNGSRGWPAAQTAAESPYTPGERVGIPAGATTGPYLYVLFDGPGLNGYEPAKNARASLAGPGGAVPVAVVDNTTSGLESYLPTGAQIIPRSPLAPGTTFSARVTATVDGKAFAHRWRFTTARGRAPFTAKVRRKGRRILVTVRAATDVRVRIKVAGVRARNKAVAAGKGWTQRIPAPRGRAAVKVVGTAAGGRHVVRVKR